jgi:hypothetical protein
MTIYTLQAVRSHCHDDFAELAIGFPAAVSGDHVVERENAVDHRLEPSARRESRRASDAAKKRCEEKRGTRRRSGGM